MASLIVHGDIQAEEPPVSRPLYVRPIIVVYLAIRRLLEGEGAELASAPSVVVVNPSLNDLTRLFFGRTSPWARLMDWLSFRYRVLFLISAGNVRNWLAVRDHGRLG